jgi:hypothetical protein
MASFEEMSPAEVDSAIEELGRRMDRLRVLYEQFFQGFERTPPDTLHKDVVRQLHQLQKVRMKGASQKFRYQTLVQRFNAMKSYWMRTMREIEEGRFKRQLARAERRQRGRGGREDNVEAGVENEEDAAAAEFLAQMGIEVAAPTAAAAAPDAGAGTGRQSAESIRGISADQVADEVARRADRLRALRARVSGGSGEAPAPAPAAAPTPAAAPAPAPRPMPTAPDPAEARARQIYERLVATKRQLNESTDHLGFEAVRRSLDQQAERTRAKHGCRDVDFDVVVKDGKAFLKPIPR